VRDPHVQVMHFSVGSGDGISNREPEPVSFVNHLGAFDLVEGKLRNVPVEHFSDEHSTRTAVGSVIAPERNPSSQWRTLC
jgi:hypothetical protein